MPEVGQIIPLETHESFSDERGLEFHPVTCLFVYDVPKKVHPDGVNTIVPTPTVDGDGNWLLPGVCKTQIILPDALIEKIDSGQAMFEVITFQAPTGLDKATLKVGLIKMFKERRELKIAAFTSMRFQYVTSPIIVMDTDLE